MFPRPLLLLFWWIYGIQLSHALSIPKRTILVVGASGGTGLRALNGLLDVGFSPQQIRVMSRSENKATALHNMGFSTCKADLDDASTLEQAVAGCIGCYVHSTSSDTKERDTGTVDRARNLANAIVLQGDIRHVVLNSAAGEADHGVYLIQQKHDVETVFFDSDIPFTTSLRANLFMEELWKKYTRPAILKGKFPFSVRLDRQIYLTSVRDMGRLAGACFSSPETTAGRIINVAGDVLTASEIADTFGTAQGSSCQHKRSQLLELFARLFFRDLYTIMKFYQKSTETTNVETLKSEFPGLLTSFPAFLQETNWGDSELTYEDLNVIQKQLT